MSIIEELEDIQEKFEISRYPNHANIRAFFDKAVFSLLSKKDTLSSDMESECSAVLKFALALTRERFG